MKYNKLLILVALFTLVLCLISQVLNLNHELQEKLQGILEILHKNRVCA